MSAERTEKPTPKRRQEARKKGQLARRPELAAATAFLASLLMLRTVSGDLWLRASKIFVNALRRADGAELTPLAVHRMLIEGVANAALLAVPVIASALVAGMAANFAQGGLSFTPSALKPRGERFNPLANLKRAFGLNGVVELLKSLLVLGGIGAVCYGFFSQTVSESPALVGATAPAVFTAAGHLVYELAWRAGAVALCAAAADYGYGWYQHEKSLRMTKQEIKDEYKQQEGDPHVKGQRRRAARALVQRSLQAVPRADVVITNPTHFAVAIRYERDTDAAPVVVAKGADLVAKRIREIAQENRVAVIENPPLARALYRAVDVGKVIPSEFFRAVAELLAYVYRQREEH